MKVICNILPDEHESCGHFAVESLEGQRLAMLHFDNMLEDRDASDSLLVAIIKSIVSENNVTSKDDLKPLLEAAEVYL